MRHRFVPIAVVFVVVAGCLGAPGAAPGTTEASDSPTTEPTDTEQPPGTSTEAVDGTLEVHVLNVGQADSILIVGPKGDVVLIDTGGWQDDGERVLNYLDDQGIDRIDYLVTTHAHADHIGGHEAVIDHYEEERNGVGAVYDPGVATSSKTYERYLDAVERHDVTLYQAEDGDTIPIEGATVTLLNPPADADSDDIHDNSIATKVEFGDASFLFTGDADADAEERIVDEHDVTADVVWAGHHGSNTSSSSTFLDAVDPKVALVSSAYDSQYGHPHEEVLQRLADRDIATYWTAVHGRTVLSTDGDTITIATQADATTNPLDVRSEDAVDVDSNDRVEERMTVDARSQPAHALGGSTSEVAAA